jgi:hypothetical protein
MKARSAGACALPRASFGAGGRGRGGNGHRQTYQVRRAVGPDAVAGPGGEPLTNGATFEVTGSGQGVHAFASSCRYLPDCSERAGVRLGHHLAVRHARRRWSSAGGCRFSPTCSSGRHRSGGFNAPAPGPITTDLPPRSPTRPGRSRGERARPPIRRTTPSGSWPAEPGPRIGCHPRDVRWAHRIPPNKRPVRPRLAASPVSPHHQVW